MTVASVAEGWLGSPTSTKCLAVVLLAVSPAASQAQVFGRVLEDGSNRPIAGASVSLVDREGNRRAELLVDSLGRFVLVPPSDGEYAIEARHLGYEPLRSPLLSMRTNSRAEIDLLLTPQPLKLEGLEVSVESDAVRVLRQYGQTPEALGRRWIDRERIESITSAFRTEDIIRWQAIPGAFVEVSNKSPSLSPLCVRSLRGRMPCALTVLNGAVIDPVEANQLDPMSIESIAVLSPMEAATLFGTQAAGGAVLIWLR